MLTIKFGYVILHIQNRASKMSAGLNKYLRVTGPERQCEIWLESEHLLNLENIVILWTIFRDDNFSVGPTKNQKLSARRADRNLGDLVISEMTTWYSYEKWSFIKKNTCLFWMSTFETGGESKENAGNSGSQYGVSNIIISIWLLLR